MTAKVSDVKQFGGRFGSLLIGCLLGVFGYSNETSHKILPSGAITVPFCPHICPQGIVAINCFGLF